MTLEGDYAKLVEPHVSGFLSDAIFYVVSALENSEIREKAGALECMQ